jgi:hypothetical protein
MSVADNSIGISHVTHHVKKDGVKKEQNKSKRNKHNHRTEIFSAMFLGTQMKVFQMIPDSQRVMFMLEDEH